MVLGEKTQAGYKIDLEKIKITDVPLPQKQINSKDGKHAILFSPLEIQRSEALFQFTIIAKFSRGRPTMETIRNYIASQWGLKNPVVVGLMDPRHVLIKLVNAPNGGGFVSLV